MLTSYSTLTFFISFIELFCSSLALYNWVHSYGKNNNTIIVRVNKKFGLQKQLR